MNKILKEDLIDTINDNYIEYKKLENSTVLITGATGLIGSILVRAILVRNKKNNSKIKLILMVRNKEEAEKKFGITDDITYIESSIEKFEPQKIDIDYIIHMASPTKSKFFIDNPVETLDISFNGTKRILEQAKMSKVKSFVYLSSMEMYGTMNDNNVTEEKIGYINNLNERSSYSEGKRIGELLSFCFYKEYDVPIKIARLAQTFGAGISLNETRVYKMFCDCILQKKNIILKTDGSTLINYCYTTDAIKGILTILLNGKSGEAYNIVSNNVNMTILDSAKWLSKKYTNDQIKIEFDINPKAFAPNNAIILNNDKIKSLGWKPKYNVLDGYDRLIKYLKEEENEK